LIKITRPLSGAKHIPRFKPQDHDWILIPVSFNSPILPGSFEYAVCHLVDHELDLTPLLQRYKNDETGASAFHPGVLLKIILVTYSKGILSSRKIEACCRENVLFIARMSDYIAPLFAQTLVIYDREQHIDRSMFAIDGVKLPVNASKSKSGTRSDYQKQFNKIARQ
jgi:transposase